MEKKSYDKLDKKPKKSIKKNKLNLNNDDIFGNNNDENKLEFKMMNQKSYITSSWDYGQKVHTDKNFVTNKKFAFDDYVCFDNGNIIETFDIKNIDNIDNINATNATNNIKNNKYKLALPFDDIDIVLKQNPLISYFSQSPKVDYVMNGVDDNVDIYQSDLKLPTKHHNLIVPIDLGICDNKSSVLINLSELGKYFNAHIMGETFISFSNNEYEIAKMYLFYDKDYLIDSIDGDMFDILKKVSKYEFAPNMIKLPFFNKFPSRGIQLFYNEIKDFKVLIRFKTPIKNTKIELYATLYYLSPSEIMNSFGLHNSFLFVQYGKNSLIENKKITKKTAIISLEKFDGEMAEIWILFKSTNKINPTCLLRNNGNIISVIDSMINKINLKKLYNHDYKNEENMYLIPFALINPHLNLYSSGSLNAKNNLSLEIKFDNTDIELKNLEIKIFAPTYNFVNVTNNNVKLKFE